MARPSCKESILEAAEAVVVAVGAARLTIDAVAAQSGVSKGGVLYHFPSKEALLEGMVVRHIERSDARRQAIVDQIPPGPARDLLGEIQWLLGPREPDDQVRSAAILAVIANQPALMNPIRERQRERFDALSAPGSPSHERALVLLAVNGLFLMELLQASPFTAAERQDLLHALIERAQEVSREG